MIKYVVTVIECGLNFFELIKSVMEKILRGTFFEITDVVFFFVREGTVTDVTRRRPDSQYKL